MCDETESKSKSVKKALNIVAESFVGKDCFVVCIAS